MAFLPLCCLLFLGMLLTTARATDDFEILDPFVYPDPADFNVSVADSNWTEGYNPWMPEYYGSEDPSETTFVLLTGGCIPVEFGGSTFFQESAPGWRKRCDDLGIACKCRPIIKSAKWNVDIPKNSGVYGGTHHCSWEIRRVLDEHRRGLIKLGGVAAACDFRHPAIYNEAREIGVPIFLVNKNRPEPGDNEYGLPEPDGYVGVDSRQLGKTMAKSLKQLRPQGGIYGFVMQWESSTANRQRDGFNEEMRVLPSDKEDVPEWHEVTRYPYERPYNLSVPCRHLECQMEGLMQNSSADSVIFMYQTPIKDSRYHEWVDKYRPRNISLLSVGTSEFMPYLNTGYLDGLTSQIVYQMGSRSAEALLETFQKVQDGTLALPIQEKPFFETKVVAYNVIPLNLDTTHPPQLDQNLLGNLVWVGYVGYGIILVSAMLCTGWTIVNRSAIVVRAAQPFFLLILLVGIVILASTIIPLSLEDGGDPDSVSERFAVGVCMSQPWLAFTGFSVIFSALFSKTWRVNKLFSTASSHLRVQVSRKDVLAPFAVVFTCNVIILTCWTIIDPLTYIRLVGDGTDFWNRSIESYGACRSDHALAFLIPLAVVNFGVVGIACWQAFEGRKIESAFAESKYIALAVASLFQAFLTGFPILVIVKEDPQSFFLVLTLMILVLSEGILLLIFLPKITMAYKFSHMSEADQKKDISQQIKKSTKRKSSFAFGSDSLSNNVGSANCEDAVPGRNREPQQRRQAQVSSSNVLSDDRNATVESCTNTLPSNVAEQHPSRNGTANDEASNTISIPTPEHGVVVGESVLQDLRPRSVETSDITDPFSYASQTSDQITTKAITREDEVWET